MNKRDKLAKFSKIFMDGLNNQDVHIGFIFLKNSWKFQFNFKKILYINLTNFSIFWETLAKILRSQN
jgi:hypothetical protein